MTNPMVSVIMITYGHEKFIEEAVNGVLMQQCNFEVELILANDCSPDETDSIIQNIIQNHPKSSIIKYFKHKTNIGMTPNFVFAFNQTSGKYIALCEGDDYWTDPLKLQKQLDFLESNTTYSGCFHNVYNKNDHENTEIIAIDEAIEKTEYSFDDLIEKNKIATCSFFFKKSLLSQNKNWQNYKNLIDDLLVLIIALKGKIKFINQVMGVYRIHSGGISSMRERETGIKLMIKYKKEILNYFKNEEPEIVKDRFHEQIGKYYLRLTIHYLKINRYGHFVKNLFISSYHAILGKKNIFKTIFKPIWLIIKNKIKALK